MSPKYSPVARFEAQLAIVEVRANYSHLTRSRPYFDIPPSAYFDIPLCLAQLLEHKSIFSAGYTAVLHVHAVAEECSIVSLTASIDKKTGAPPPPPLL